MSSAAPVTDTLNHRAIAAAVESWFSLKARNLPWRHRRTGYTALVSEAMLQQTQVRRVIEKYESFMQCFPTLRALAEADEQSVLAAWQGLGYYRRARHLHAAARVIVREHSGLVPRTAAELMQLPGVGRYTAGAIASIIFGERTPLVDGNVQRVLARLVADDRSPTAPEAVRDSWQRADDLVNASTDPGALNEGLMELGALICTPAKPRCGDCPLAVHCQAHRTGRERTIPPPKKSALQQSVVHHAVVITRGSGVLLEQRPSEGLWSNMWQVPTVEAALEYDGEGVRAAMPFPLITVRLLDSFLHQTTHRRITFRVFIATTRVRRGCWVRIDELDQYPLANPQRRIIDRYVLRSR